MPGLGINNVIYSTDYFGGSDQVTDSEGKAPSDITVIYRVFNGSSTSTDNTTKVKLRVGDWFKTEISETDDTRVDIDFDVPEFRIFNPDAQGNNEYDTYQNQGYYNYIQRAIDNRDYSTGCTVHMVTEELDSGKILMQEEVPIHPYDSLKTLTMAVHQAEHRIFPKVLRNLNIGSE